MNRLMNPHFHNGEQHDKLDKDAANNYATQGHKKLWAYFLELVKSDYFKQKIIEWRTWYKIPKEGFKLKGQKDRYAWYKLDKDTGKIIIGIGQTPDGQWDTLPPTEWELFNTEREKDLIKEIEELCMKYRLHPMDWEEPIERYLFYNDLDFTLSPNYHNLCHISDIIEEKEDPFLPSTVAMNDMAFPIAIRISPYASNNDIVDFVRKMAGVIEGAQSRYRDPDIKIGKVKAKRTDERDEFIYQNQGKPSKEIARLVKERFGGKLLPYEYIPKIISREKRKRQKA